MQALGPDDHNSILPLPPSSVVTLEKSPPCAGLVSVAIEETTVLTTQSHTLDTVGAQPGSAGKEGQWGSMQFMLLPKAGGEKCTVGGAGEWDPGPQETRLKR